MIKIYIIIGILFLLAGISNAFQDKVRVKEWDNSVFSELPADHWFTKFAGPGSQANKWKNGDRAQGERFPGSSTCFVFLMDGWHFFQMLHRALLTIIAVILVFWLHISKKRWFYKAVLLFMGFSIPYWIGFNLFYDFVLKLN